MSSDNVDSDNRYLLPRAAFAPDARQPLWRVVAGVLRIDSAPQGEGSRFVRLALPGDVIGVERWAGTQDGLSQRALVISELAPVADTGQQMMHLLMDSVVVAHQRCREVVTLRTGPAARRVQALLLMLAQSGVTEAAAASPTARDVAVPHLADLSDILDVAPETISRVFGSLRDMAVLEDRKPQKARFSRQALRGLEVVAGMSASLAPRKLRLGGV